MSKEIREIIAGLNIAVSVLVTETLIRYVFFDLHGLRLAIIAVTLAICLYNWLNWMEQYFIHRKGKTANEGKNGRIKGTGNGSNIPGMPWHEVRFGASEPQNRHP